MLAAASGADMEAVRALQRIERLRNSTPDISQQPVSPKSATNTPQPKSTSPLPRNTPSNPKPITPKSSTTYSPSPVINLSRRKVIQTVGVVVTAVAGFGTVISSISSLSEHWEFYSGKTSTSKMKTFPFQTAKVDAKGNVISRPKLQGKQFVEDLGNGVTLEMVQIPGGTFMMGSPPTEKDRGSDESPQRQVKVSGFFMGKYEVTQAQYQAIMEKNPSHFKGENQPVEQVSWDDAVEFCKKLSEKTGRKYKLPSEAEWEYACRAGTETPFYFGETITPELVNYNGDYPYGAAPKGKGLGETTNVGIFPANPFGLCDMCGNVYEWCQDVYNKNYQGAPEDRSAWLNSKDNNIKLLRGGSWITDARNLRSASCRDFARENRFNYVGFRVVAGA
ncbi:formylglycine-generating enzyme family protein [Nostoc cycadae]